MAHFENESPSEFKQRLGPYFETALVRCVPAHGIKDTILKEWLQKLWAACEVARFDLGWSWMRVRDRMPFWAERISRDVEIDLDSEDKQDRWSRLVIPDPIM